MVARPVWLYEANFEDAVNLVNKVKKRDEQKYELFLHILNEFRAKKIDMSKVVDEVTLLLQDRDLLDEFYSFLPQDFSRKL
ncbi:hypothetical protein EV1_038623 [Malus domestica]